MFLNKVWAEEFADKVSVRKNKLGALLTCCVRVQIFCELLQLVDWRREENQHYSRLLAKTISTSTVLIVFTTIYRELCNGSCSQDSQWDLHINYEVLHVQHMLYEVLWWLNFSTVSTVVWFFALTFSVFLSCGLLLYSNFPFRTSSGALHYNWKLYHSHCFYSACVHRPIWPVWRSSRQNKRANTYSTR